MHTLQKVPMDKEEALARIREIKEEIEAIDGEKGELMSQIQEVQKQLELCRSQVATWETKVKEGNSLGAYATSIVVIVLSIFYIAKNCSL
jgi:predicted  nucleic acid-binding Zn-ribbon protein